MNIFINIVIIIILFLYEYFTVKLVENQYEQQII